MRYRVPIMLVVVLAGTARGESLEDAAVLQKAAVLAAEREDLEKALIAIVKSAGPNAPSPSAKRDAVRLLGRIGGARSVPVLIEVVSDMFSGETAQIQDHNDIGEIPPTPAMESLARLGPLAIMPLIDAITTDQHPVTSRDKVQALALLPCRKLAHASLKQRLAVEQDEKVRERLRHTLTRLEE